MSHRHPCPCGTGATECPNPTTGRPLCADADDQVGTGWTRNPARPLSRIPTDHVAWEGGVDIDDVRIQFGGMA